MFKSKDDDSLGSEDAHYHKPPPSKGDMSKDDIIGKGDANSASSHNSLEGGKISLKECPAGTRATLKQHRHDHISANLNRVQSLICYNF